MFLKSYHYTLHHIPKHNHKFYHELKVHLDFVKRTLKVLILAYNNGEANLNGKVASKNYVWDTEIEVKDDATELDIFGAQDTYPTACVGIKEMAYILDEEHWLIEMKGYVTPKHYNSKTGLLIFVFFISFIFVSLYVKMVLILLKLSRSRKK